MPSHHPADTRPTARHDEPLDDHLLSLKAKGLYAYLLKRPGATLADVQRTSTDGRASVRTALRDLEDAELAERRIERGDDGRITRAGYYIAEATD